MAEKKKTEMILEEFKDLLETNKSVLVEMKESAKRPGTYDYLFAQLRKRAIGNGLSGIAMIRSSKFSDRVILAWVNSVDEQSHTKNKGVLYDVDAKNNFKPIANNILNIVVRETVDPTDFMYLKEGEVAVRKPKAIVDNKGVFTYPTNNGKPIFRVTVPVEIGASDDKDVLVEATEVVSTDAKDTLLDEITTSEQAMKLLSA